MDYTFKELKHSTVAKLREIAAGIEHEAVQGYTQLNKEHLLVAICKALNIDMYEHHELVGINKTELKAQIKALKADRDKFLAAHELKDVKRIRKEMKILKNKLCKARV